MILSSIDRYRWLYTVYHGALFGAFLCCALLVIAGFVNFGVARRDTLLTSHAAGLRTAINYDFASFAGRVASAADRIAGQLGSATTLAPERVAALAAQGIPVQVDGWWLLNNLGEVMIERGAASFPVVMSLRSFYDPSRALFQPGMVMMQMNGRAYVAVVKPIQSAERTVAHLVAYRDVERLRQTLRMYTEMENLDSPWLRLYFDNREVVSVAPINGWHPDFSQLNRAVTEPLGAFQPDAVPLRRVRLVPLTPGLTFGLILALEDRRVVLGHDTLLLLPAFVPFLVLLLFGIRWGRRVIEQQLIEPLVNLRDEVNRIDLDAPRIPIPDSAPEEIRSLYKTLRFFAMRSSHNLQQAQKKMNEIQMLNDVGHTLQGLSSVDKTFDTVLEAILTMAHFDRAMVARVESESQVLSGKVAFKMPSSISNTESRASYPIVIPLSIAKGGTAAKVVLTQSPYLSFNDAQNQSNLSGEVMLPLLVHGEVVGVFGVDNFQTKKPIFREDLPILEAIANQVSLSIKNATLMEELLGSIKRAEEANQRLTAASQELQASHAELKKRKGDMDREIRIATDIQQVLLPSEVDVPPGIDVAVVAYPARELGGDFYNLINLGEHRLAIVVGDVSGKGIPASLIMSLAHSLIMAQVPVEPRCTKVFERVNRQIMHSIQDMENYYVTCLLAIVDTEEQTVRLVKAGHLEPFWFDRLRKDGKWLPAEGTFMGIFADLGLEEEVYPFTPGTRLVFFTDGVTECMSRAEKIWGTKAFESFLRERADLTALELLRELEIALATHRQGMALSDDVTAVVVDHVMPIEENYTLPAKLEQVPVMLNWLQNIVRRAGFKIRPQHQLVAAVEEVTLNSVKYGAGLDPAKTVRIQARITGLRLEVIIRDEGPGFDASKYLVDDTMTLDPDTPLGIRMAQAQCSKLRYEDGGRCAIVTFEHPLRQEHLTFASPETTH